MTDEEIFSMATSVYDSHVEVLETGSVEALQAYARDLSEGIVPGGGDLRGLGTSCCFATSWPGRCSRSTRRTSSC